MPMKIIRIPEQTPGYDEPVNDFLHVIDTPQMQRLREVNQLDLIYKVFPGARHSRFEHSVGTLHHERNILNSIGFNDCYQFSEAEKKTLNLAALLHDSGHPPFSHAVEFVLMAFGEPDHDKKVLDVIGHLEPRIKSIHGIDYEMLKDVFKRKNPAWKTIWGLVGSDVLDYINRDANRCGVSIDSDSNRIETYAVFDGKSYGIDTKVLKVVRKHLQSYIFMYLEIYNRKACSMWKGVIRRGVYDAIENGGLKPKEIWKMTDDELKHSLRSSGATANKVYQRTRDRVKSETFLSLKIEGQESNEEIKRKPIRVQGMPESELMKMAEYFENIQNIIEFEKSMESEFGLEPGDVTVAEMPHIKMLEPNDIQLYDTERGWTSLYNKIPKTKEDVMLEIKREYAFRVGVIPEFRRKAFKDSQRVLDVLKSFY
jgi:hypothetical protein